MNLLKSFVNSFFEKGLMLKAAALSYTSVLTLLPLIAISFALTNFLLAQADPNQIDKLLDLILTRLVPQIELLEKPLGLVSDPEVINKAEIKKGIMNVIRQLGSGEIGLIGVSTFLFLAFSLLLTIEHSLNDIWDISSGRSILTRLGLYLLILILGSLLFILAIIFMTRWPGSYLLRTLKHVPLLPRLLQFALPFVLCWIALIFIYLVLPNTQVTWTAGLIGGVAGGTLLQINNLFSFLYLYNVATATRLYGKLGILPIFLAGLYISWLIILAGAQFTRNLEDYLA